MERQITIFDLLNAQTECGEKINSPLAIEGGFPGRAGEIPCYSCVHALKRGAFRLCRAGGDGYLHIKDIVKCGIWKDKNEEASGAVNEEKFRWHKCHLPKKPGNKG